MPSDAKPRNSAKKALPSFTALYLTADLRVLGMARIAYGLVLFYDLFRRARELRLLYTNEGVLSNHYLLFRPQANPQISFLMPFSTVAEVSTVFAAIAILYLFYTFGLFTRVAQVLVLLSITSLNARNLAVEDGGVATMIAFAVWTVFLPLGDRYSLDAIRRDAALKSVALRVRARKQASRPFVSLAVLALSLQIVAIYFLNALHKTGRTWADGDAVHLVLWQARVNTPFAYWLAQHEPAWFSPLATRATLVLEYAIPLLILYPNAASRVTGIACSFALHLGIAIIMTLGPFSYAMMALVLTRLPGEAVDRAAGRVPLRLRQRLVRARARLARRCSDWVWRHGPARPPRRKLPWRKLREGAVVFVMLAAALELSNANPAVRWKLPQPEWLADAVLYPRMTQRWSMFAPDAPRDDGYGVIDGVTADGRHIDPFTGEPPDFDRLEKGLIPGTLESIDYLFTLHFRDNERYRAELVRYVTAEWHEQDGRSDADRIVEFSFYWVSRKSPPRGSTTPGPSERELVMHHRGKR
ncbi:MAG TPA: lipase maturation factor family protein [Polyangiaceae bacterium]